MSKFAIIALLLAVLVAWNYAAYVNARHPGARILEMSKSDLDSTTGTTGSASAAPVDLPWALIEKTRLVSPEKIEFPAELKAAEGKVVRVAGVAFFLDSLNADQRANGCLLMPPSLFGCCGVSCDVKPHLMMFVNCEKSPWPNPQKKMYAAAVGRLRLHTSDTSYGMYTLEDARLFAIDAPKP